MEPLTERQRELLWEWLPGADVRADHSWGLVGTTVLEVEHHGDRYIVKAADEADTHLARELRAHREWLGPWTSIGRAPRLVRADRDAKLLVTRYQPGGLVEGSAHEQDPDVYRQAGDLLAAYHGQVSVADDEYERAERDKALRWLDRPHRIEPAAVTSLVHEISGWETPISVLVPTHGDWQPRNWLVHDGSVSVIDFGRADLRPAMTDFTRLAAQQFREHPELEAAFLEGYGDDPREPDAWRRNRVREAIGTAVWAFQVGDESFEQQGHRMIAEALDP